jgi:UDP-glucose 4-epimerase
MHVLITGGAGFIGSNLVKHFNAHFPDVTVTVFDDLSSGILANLDGTTCTFIEGSILDYDALLAAAEGVDALVHLGAIPSVPRSVAAPRPSHDANATGTLNVLEVARERNVGHVSVASSSSVYGSNPLLPKGENTWTRPMSPYGVSKLATEGYAVAYKASYGLPTIAFRFFNVFGPGQAAGHAYAAVIPKFLDAAMHNEPLMIEGEGKQSRDFTYVGTVCSVLADAALRKVSPDGPVNLAFGTNTTIETLAHTLGELMERDLVLEHTLPRVGDVFASQADGILVRELFPNVVPVELEVGLSATIEWFRQASS